uniref:Pyrimidodiazepine synthase n=1 Tax=Schistocephalus solidus TaxID=70667 RepID=A0A0V0J2J4_SCHSO
MSDDIGEHLTTGDVEPKVDPHKVTLYDMHLCPFCQRVRYTLDYHDIPYDRVLISVGAKPSWFLEMNPMGKVPLLLHNGQKMIDSDEIMKYVDQLNGPEASIMSVCGPEGFQKALDMSNSIAGHRSKLCFSSEATKDDAEIFMMVLTNIEKEIKGPYLVGDKVSLADLAFFPFLSSWDFMMDRCLKLEEKEDVSVEDFASQWPNLLKYRQLMLKKPYIMRTSIEDEDFAKFVDNFSPDMPAIIS